MTDQEGVQQKIRAVEEELRELRDARPRAACFDKSYSRPEDMQRAMRIERLEDELAELRKRADAAGA